MNATHLGDQLRLARNQLGLTLEQVKGQTGLGTSSLSEFETGTRDPSLRQLQLLSHAYQRPLSFFLSDPEPAPREAVLWRDKPEPTVSARLGRQFLELCRQFHLVERWCGEVSEPDLPVEASRPRCYQDAEALADRVRKRLGLGERPGVSLLRVLEEVARAKIFFVDSGLSGAAACTVHPEYGAGILLNAKHVPWRRNFDAAHELFHLVTWKAFGHDSSKPEVEPSEREEKFATCFARTLLMPRGPFRRAIARERAKNSTPETTVLRLAREFEVSVDAVVWARATESKWTKEWATGLIERCRKRESQLFPRDRGCDPPDRPPRFTALIYQALELGEISLGRAAQFLGVPRGVVRRNLRADATI